MTTTNSQRALKCRQLLKERMVRIFGNGCNVCGYDRSINALEFHHLDPSQKDFGLSCGITRSVASVVKEAEKCIMLCANCHREVHNGITTVSLQDSKFDRETANQIIQEVEYNKSKKFDNCGCGAKKRIQQKFCSKECCDNEQRDTPKKLLTSDEQLIVSFEELKSFEAVGRLYNVTGAAVKRRLKKIQHI